MEGTHAMSENNIEFEGNNYLVCFLDALGIRSKKREELIDVFPTLRKLKDDIRKGQKSAKTVFNIDYDVELRTFSDNFFIVIKCNKNDHNYYDKSDSTPDVSQNLRNTGTCPAGYIISFFLF